MTETKEFLIYVYKEESFGLNRVQWNLINSNPILLSLTKPFEIVLDDQPGDLTNNVFQSNKLDRQMAVTYFNDHGNYVKDCLYLWIRGQN